MPAEALWELGKTYAVGAKKHGWESWREPRSWLEVYDAMMRHMLQWRMGEDKSSDDHHYHMGAVAHRALWLLTYHLDLENYGTSDDRVSKTKQKKDKRSSSNDTMGYHQSTSRCQKGNKKRKEKGNHGKA